MRILLFGVAAVIASALVQQAAAANGSPPLRITPAVVEMGAFYIGARVRFNGLAQPGTKVVVVVKGAGRNETFNRKRRFGPIWINSGKVRVSRVPSLLLRFSDAPLRTFLTRETMDRHQLDEVAIMRQMHIEPDEDSDVILSSWLSLKSHEGVYALVRDGVKMGTPGPNGVPYRVDFQWPKQAPPATYEVRVYECRDRTVVSTFAVPLKVVKVGFPAWLSSTARNQSLAYGVVAAIVAALAGFGIDSLVALISGGRRVSAH